MSILDCPEVIKNIIESRHTEDDKTFLLARQCGSIEDKYYVCCVEPKRNTSLETKPALNYLPTAPSCGIDLKDHLSVGLEAEIDEFPWAAFLQYTHRKYHDFV